MWWYGLKAFLGRTSVEDSRIDLCAEGILPLETEGSSQSPLCELLACTSWKATVEKRKGLGGLFSWLQQKCPGEVSWAVVSLGGHCAYEVSYSHLRYMAEVTSGVNGALVCDCVYLAVIVFPIHSLVELSFWYSWLAFQPEEEYTLHVHWGWTAACCYIERGQTNAVRAWKEWWLLGLPQKNFPNCNNVSRKLVWPVLFCFVLVGKESCSMSVSSLLSMEHAGLALCLAWLWGQLCPMSRGCGPLKFKILQPWSVS